MFAFIFDSVGAGEWLILLAVVLVVMGPKRLPSTARKIGSFYSKFRRAADSFKRQLMDMDREIERAANDATRDIEESARDLAEVTQDVSRPPEGFESGAMYPGPADGDMPVEDPSLTVAGETAAGEPGGPVPGTAAEDRQASAPGGESTDYGDKTDKES